MRIQTRGNSNVVWLSSGEGVINGTMSLSAPALERILQAVNEKYGTSFEGWSQKPTVYEVGDTVPDWSAYEKILQPMSKFATLYEDNKYLYGTISQEGRDRVARVNIGGSSGGGILCSEDGIVLGEYTPRLTNTDLQSIKARINNAGGNIQGVSTTYVSIAEGTQIELWQSYVRV